MNGKNDHIFVPISSTDTNVGPAKKSCRRVSSIDDDTSHSVIIFNENRDFDV